MAVGYRETNQNITNVVSIKVYVKNKMTKEEVTKAFGQDGLIPKTVANVRTDVVHAGDVRAQNTYISKVRPLRPGYSVGHPTTTAGTIGGFYRDSDGDVILLSNNHVLAVVNNAKICDVCVQPGPFDKTPNPFRGWIKPVINLDQIGFLKDYVRLEASGNLQDSAILKVHEDIIANSGIVTAYPDGIISQGGPLAPTIGMNVIKFGRTTGMTTGTITAINGTQDVNFGPYGTISFSDCIYTTPMSSGGDSGSVVMSNEPSSGGREDVGLLFAGSPSVTICNPISYAYTRYNILFRLP